MGGSGFIGKERRRELSEILKRISIQASTPGRIDCGGTWDIKALAIAAEVFQPITVNIAINLRTMVQLSPYLPGRVFIQSDSFGSEDRPADELSFRGPFGLLNAIVSHFSVSGLKICVQSAIPVRSGLGGSGAAAVALIGALSKALEFGGYLPAAQKDQMALLAHTIEDGMGISVTGMQDQLAAAHGGVNKWIWKYSCFEHPFERQILLNRENYEELQKRIMIVSTGEKRDSSQVTHRYIESFMSGKDQKKWFMIKAAVEDFAWAVHQGQWEEAARSVKREARIRDSILLDHPTVISSQLRKSADESGCALAFAGGNRGGCMWAMGEKDALDRLRQRWEIVSYQFPQVYIFPIEIASMGLEMICHEQH